MVASIRLAVAAGVAHGEAQIRTTEIAAHDGRGAQVEVAYDLVDDRRGGGGGERDGGYIGCLTELAESHVLRAEVVAPLAHAVGLVDGEARDTHAFDHALEPRKDGALRRHVEQLELALEERCDDALALDFALAAVECLGVDAPAAQGVDLVGHERDQRRDDHGGPLAVAAGDQRGDLVAERLSSAGGQEHDGVLTLDQRLDGGFLAMAELWVAEDLFQNALCGSGGWTCGAGGRLHHHPLPRPSDAELRRETGETRSGRRGRFGPRVVAVYGDKGRLMGRIFETRKATMFARWNKMSKAFTRIAKELTMAAKAGGPDPDGNPTLRRAIANARAVNMPKDKIDGAIKRAHAKDTADYQECIYEGYAPHGVAVMVVTATDNPTRTVANVRVGFNKGNGNMGQTGSVSFGFSRMGVFRLDATKVETDLEELELELIDHGLEEMGESASEKGEPQIVIRCALQSFGEMQTALEERGMTPVESLTEFIPGTTVKLDEDKATEVLKMIDLIEQDDDVQHVFHNLA